MNTDDPTTLGHRGRHFSLRSKLIAFATIVALGVGTLAASGLTIGGTASSASAPGDQSRFAPMPAASAGPAALDQNGKSLAGGSTTDQNAPVSPADTTQIVKTGSMSLEVSDLNTALAKAKANIVAIGGNIAASQTYGTGDQVSASVTYRLPVESWDQALSDLHAMGKLLTEQTNVSDVTAQVVDIGARLTNLQATETALLGIMTRATAITDVLAVQNQLTTVRGEIEQLTAQRDYLKNQAAMSTLTVTFSLPGQSVVTSTTANWDIGHQIDQAAAALVSVAQAAITIALWALIVGLPVALAALIILGLFWFAPRRLLRRRHKAVTTP
jgi:hypothetical protein